MAPSTAAPAADCLLASLDPEQRAAGTLPDGPAQVIARPAAARAHRLRRPVAGAVAALEIDQDLRSRWQARFSDLCVDEFQDVDSAQLGLVRLLAAPEDNLFVAAHQQARHVAQAHSTAPPEPLAGRT